MKSIEKAYLAGLIDGEGCITIAKRKSGQRKGEPWYYQPVVSIGNTDKGMIDYVYNLTHGFVLERKGRRSQKQKKEWKRVYSLFLTGEKMRQALKEILPYLRTKRRQAEILLEFPSYAHRGRMKRNWEEIKRQDSLWREIRELNQRGPKAVYPQLKLDLDLVDKQLEFRLSKHKKG